MKLLLLSFYYPPDLSAGSFRMNALVQALVACCPAGTQIDILTTMPNRYSSYAKNAEETESIEGVSITRIRLPSHTSGMLDQAWAFQAFARAVLSRVRKKEYDLVFATSSRLMTAALGAVCARMLRVPLYLDIRDIFVDTIRDILPGWTAAALVPFFSLIERFSIGSATKINLVSKGFLRYFTPRYPSFRFRTFSNGIDKEFIDPPFINAKNAKAIGPIRIVYAGNIGEGQALHLIVPELAKSLGDRAEFIIIGDGGRKPALRDALAACGTSNAILKDPLDRPQIRQCYEEADILFLHLNNLPAFEKVLPSKLFEYAATGKPILAGVAGYCADFMRDEVSGAAIFSPCDVASALAAIEGLLLDPIPRTKFIEIYDRRRIMDQLADDIMETYKKDKSTRSANRLQ